MLGNFFRYMTESWTDVSDDFLPFDSDLAEAVEGEFAPFFGADEQQLSVTKSTLAGPEISFSTASDGNWNVSASAEKIGEVSFGLSGEHSCKVESSFSLPWGSTSVGSCLALLGATTSGEYTAGIKFGPLAAKMVAAKSSADDGLEQERLQFNLDASAKFPLPSYGASMFVTLQDNSAEDGGRSRRVGISYQADSWTLAVRQSLPLVGESRNSALLGQVVTTGILGTVSARIANSAADGWEAAAACKWPYLSGAFPTIVSLGGSSAGVVGAGVTVDVVDCSFSLGAHSQIEGRRPSWPTFGVEAKF